MYSYPKYCTVSLINILNNFFIIFKFQREQFMWDLLLDFQTTVCKAVLNSYDLYFSY